MPVVIRRDFRRRAAAVLAAFVVVLMATVAAPWMQADAQETCDMHSHLGMDAHEDHDDSGATPDDPVPIDHTAHCPLCLPVSAPPAIHLAKAHRIEPAVTVLVATTVATRAVDPVAAPLPARGPPPHPCTSS